MTGDTVRTLRLVILIALTATSLLAQPREGRMHELSLSGSYQNYSSGSSSGSSGAFLISPRFGFYVVQGFEIEPEILLMLSPGSDPVYMVNGNISYNFLSAGKTIPFVVGGYGLANTVPFFGVPLMRIDFAVGVLNLGGGIKAFVKEDIAVRVEYRYQKFSGEGETTLSSSFSYIHKVDVTIHTVQFGISILL
jgi:hypothetical protein